MCMTQVLDHSIAFFFGNICNNNNNEDNNNDYNSNHDSKSINSNTSRRPKSPKSQNSPTILSRHISPPKIC